MIETYGREFAADQSRDVMKDKKAVVLGRINEWHADVAAEMGDLT